MQILVQTTLAIQILYYLLITSVKISICFCYLRIGVFWPSQYKLVTDKSPSCGQTLRPSGQGDYLLSRHLLRNLCYRLLDAMHSPPSNVELHRGSIGNLYKHHCTVLQYVTHHILKTHFADPVKLRAQSTSSLISGSSPYQSHHYSKSSAPTAKSSASFSFSVSAYFPRFPPSYVCTRFASTRSLPTPFTTLYPSISGRWLKSTLAFGARRSRPSGLS